MNRFNSRLQLSSMKPVRRAVQPSPPSPDTLSATLKLSPIEHRLPSPLPLPLAAPCYCPSPDLLPVDSCHSPS